MLMRRFGAAAEVILVLALFLLIRVLLRDADFGDRQVPLFGRAVVSSIILFFVLPLAFVLISGRQPGDVGLTVKRLGYHGRVALRAIMFVAPVTVLFPVIAFIGSDHKEWLGASMLAAAFIIGGLIFAFNSRNFETASKASLSWTGLSFYVALLIVGLVLSYFTNPVSQIATRLIAAIIFVGFLEEFFFRGYVQSRLNDCFGRPFSFCGVSFGPGLILAAAAFGLFHPITVAGDPPWAWALWTGAGGLVFGYLREKTGAAIAPAMLHGAIWIPGVLFGPG